MTALTSLIRWRTILLALLLPTWIAATARSASSYTMTVLGPADIWDWKPVSSVNNDTGGYSYSNDFQSGTPVLSEDGSPLVEVPYPAPGYSGMSVHGINSSGVAVGMVYGSEGIAPYKSIPFEYTPGPGGGSTVPLPLPIGISHGSATAINDSGIIVGEYDDGVKLFAFVSDGHTTQNLNDLIGPENSKLILSASLVIGENGQIIALATNDGSRDSVQGYEVLLTPTTAPEPSILLGMATLPVGWAIRKFLRRRG